MSNMSYCRFENTSNDMSDCLDALREAVEEDEQTPSQFAAGLGSEHERRAYDRLVSMCRAFVELAESD